MLTGAPLQQADGNWLVTVIVFILCVIAKKCQGGPAIGLTLGQPVFLLSSRAPCEECLCAFGRPVGGVWGEWFLLNLRFLCVFVNVGGFGIAFVTFHGEKV